MLSYVSHIILYVPVTNLSYYTAHSSALLSDSRRVNVLFFPSVYRFPLLPLILLVRVVL